VSFNNNDEDGDGLAALFGGITPTATPKPAEAARPAAAPTAQPPAAPGYPTAAPVAVPTAAPGYPGAAPYDLPAPTEAPPASAYPSAAPQYPGLAPTADQQYAATGYPAQQTPAQQSPPSGVPQDASGLPSTQYAATQYPPDQHSSAQYPPEQYPPEQYPPTQAPTMAPPPQYAATQYTATPAPTQDPTSQFPPAQYPGLAPQGTPGAPPSYDLPAPVTQAGPAPQYPAQAGPSGTPTPLAEPAAYPAYEQPVPGYSTAPPADFAQPATYDLPPPAAAPSLPPVSGYEPAPSFGQPAGSDATARYDAPPAYPPSNGYEASPAERFSAVPQGAPFGQPAEGQFGGSASTSGYGGSEPPAGAALLPQAVTPAGPLLPSRAAAVVTPEDLERSTVGERIALVLALIAGPIGLLAAIVTAVRGGQRRGWIIGISRVSLALGVLSTIATVILGVVYWNIRVDQMHHDELAAASAEFCAAAEADPAMVTPPTVGFPTQGNSIPETIDAMTAWTTRWTDLAATSPAELRTGLELLATKGQEIVDSVTESRSVDDALNAQVIGSVEAQSGVSAWYTTYCVAP